MVQVGRQFEVEIATAEMERAQQRLMTLEREKQNLEAKVSNILTMRSGGAASSDPIMCSCNLWAANVGASTRFLCVTDW